MNEHKSQKIDTEALKKEVKEELIKQEILLGLEEDEVDLFELAKVLFKYWKLVIVFPFIVACVTALYSLTLPNHFKAEASIFVHSGNGKMSSLLSSLPMAGLLGGLGTGGGGADYLVAYLKSRTLSEKIIAKYGVATNPMIVGTAPAPDEKVYYDDVLRKVNDIIALNKSKEGLITVSAETLSATLSADIVDTYIKYLETFSKGPQKEKRIFVETQLKKTSRELEAAEIALKEFQDKHKIFSVETEAKKLIEKSAQLEAQKIESGINLKMQQSLLKASGNVPQLVKVESKKVSEEAKLKELDKEIELVEAKLAEQPEKALEFARLKRTLQVKIKIFGVLTEQLEMAKISEAEEGSQFEILDKARAPERKSRPRRSIMVILAGLAAGVLGVFGAFLIEFIKRKKREIKEEKNNDN